MDEVEARFVGIDERAFLLNMRAEHFAQRLMHQVRRRVVAGRARTTNRINLGLHDVANLQRALVEHAVMTNHVSLHLLRVENGETHACVASKPVSPTWPPDSA